MKRAVSSRAGCSVGVLLVAVLVPGCGGDVYPESVYAQHCAQPRAGIDPATQQPYPDVVGTLWDEKQWIHAWIDDLYLWYREVPNLDISRYRNAVSYFDDDKTMATTASGKAKDQFHFIYKTTDWEALSQSGTEASYGIQWALLAASPPRSLVIAYTEPGSPAAAANLGRGAKIMSIDGVDVENGSDVDTLNNGLYPAQLGEAHSFVVQDLGADQPRTVMLTSASVEITPVQSVHTLPPPNDKVGYFLFTDHIATAESGLVNAITQLRNAGITDLILDLRYNGGGYLDIASELAYMIAGPTATAGKTFERLEFNDRYPTTDPFSGLPLEPEGFVDHSEGFVTDLLGSVPSLVFGLWGSDVFQNPVRDFSAWLNHYFKWIPLFGGDGPFGQSILLGSLVLAIMVLPIVTSLSREVFQQTPGMNEEAALALGATKWEMIRTAVLPYGKPGVIAAVMLGLGRALGETIALAMTLGIVFNISFNLIQSGGNSIAANIANTFGEANATGRGALIASGLVLFAITLVVNMTARAIIYRRREFRDSAA